MHKPIEDNMIVNFVAFCVRSVLRLRYHVTVKGFDKLPDEYKKSALVLPNHPALVDPLIVMSQLYPKLKCSPLGKRKELERPIIRTLGKMMNAVAIDEVNSSADAKNASKSLETLITELKKGHSVLLYPSGRLYRSKFENMRGNSAVYSILKAIPNQKVILVRTSGLWGSCFGFGQSVEPKVVPLLKRRAFDLLKSFIFFMKKREVVIELEPGHLDANDSKQETNIKLEAFYNAKPLDNLFVPYSMFGKSHVMPEPQLKQSRGKTEVPHGTRLLVINHLKEVTGKHHISETDKLSNDLGLDSLTLTEVAIWMEKEFGYAVSDLESIETVDDLLQVSVGNVASKVPEFKVSESWKKSTPVNLDCERFDNLCDLFKETALKNKNQTVIADTARGEMSYKKLIMGILFLKSQFEKVPEQNIGIMLPATNAAVTTYWAAVFAGKTPVMVNWTVGSRNMRHCMETAELKRIYTVRPLSQKVFSSDPAMKELEESFYYLEDFAKTLTLPTKLSLLFKTTFAKQFLKPVKVAKNAVILFTSGSESFPKAVPLTHTNLLTNLKDISKVINLNDNDSLVGILPPFHSFGLTVNIVLATCFNIKAVYHSNPNETTIINEVIKKYRPTAFLGTPTFFNSILSTIKDEDMQSLRMAIVGAEKCPEKVYNLATSKNPNIKVVEGYGITECSPAISLNDLDNPVIGSIGKPLSSVSWKIVHQETYKELPEGERGLLIVSGPSIFEGYYNSELNPFIELEGKKWYNTGDLVEVDSDGVFHFKGRLKRFVKIGGEMISLPAIESALMLNFPNDEEGPAIAVEATTDEKPELILFSKVETTRDEANTIIRTSGLSPLHNIKVVRTIEKIPILGSGKTDYQTLKRILGTRM
jgi:long-chain-fatty-acid--[acyl-carrier-protein] ligase